MDRAAAEAEIKALFAHYHYKITHTDRTALQALSDGKIYELYVLSEVVADLVGRGCTIYFQGSRLKFKASPGQIKSSDPHFEVHLPDGTDLSLFVDIEFETLGRTHTGATDHSRRHELDIILVDTSAGYPSYQNVWLAVECKAVANFTKGLLKEVLGVRRELSVLRDDQPSLLTNAGLSPSVDVPAHPASEFWLAFIDPKGKNYRESPAAFGIQFRHLDP